MALSHKIIQMSPDQLAHDKQLEHSIQHWSVEFTRTQIQADRIKESVSNITDERMRHVNAVLKASGINPEHVRGVHIEDDGTMRVTVLDTVPTPTEDAPVEEVSPTADPVGLEFGFR